MKNPRDISEEVYGTELEKERVRVAKLEAERDLNKMLSEERKTSNELYAKILVEKIVYWFIVLICTAVFGAILTLVIKK